MAIEHRNVTESHPLMTLAASVYLWKHRRVDCLFSVIQTFHNIDVVSAEKRYRLTRFYRLRRSYIVASSVSPKIRILNRCPHTTSAISIAHDAHRITLAQLIQWIIAMAF